jgi:signal transduction histidine kinase
LASSARKQTWIYAAVLAGCVGVCMFAALSPAGKRLDNIPYDAMLSAQSGNFRTADSVVVAIDEATLHAQGGMPAIRSILAGVINKVNAAHPAAVADDVLLADPTKNDEDNAALEAALRATRNLILPCDIDSTGKWEDPLPRFAQSDVALGHVHRDQSEDMNRFALLRAVVGGKERKALALETFSAARGQPIIYSPGDVQIGDVVIPARDPDRRMWIAYVSPGVPVVSALAIDQNLDELRGKAVFVGITASGANDRPVTPLGEISGVVLHAYIYDTIARGRFLTPVRNGVEFVVCALFAAAAGFIFKLRSGGQAYALGVLLLGLSVWTPFEFFRHDQIFPFFEPVSVAWLSVAAAATFQHFFVRRQLRTSESERSRYQQTLQWAAHEMRTPLTAIQGSSEIMTRYALPDAKRHELSAMINSESKRLARMIQTFLDIERLADGQMEMKREPFAAAAVVETCMKRAGIIAERKKIRLFLDSTVEGTLSGDRELMEYAFYNLLTNAVKYSPPETEIHVESQLRGGELRLAVRDQGIGMDEKEIKNIFKKFYRTKRAEASGENGTGIGLSIVEQIVTQHGGRMEVASAPGQGSCFTMIVAATGVTSNKAAVSHNAETSDRRG